MGADLPNDAIGATNAITGSILAYPDGRIVKDSSKIVIDVRSLKSDQSRRDGFLQRRTLETEKYPTVELSRRRSAASTASSPRRATSTFQLLGDLMIQGVTHPTVWNVTAHPEGQDFAGYGDDGVHLQGHQPRPAEGAGRAERRGHDQAGVRFPDGEAVDAAR